MIFITGPLAPHISHWESEWIAKASTFTFIKQVYLFSGLMENSSWVLSQPWWVLIQENDWSTWQSRFYPSLLPITQRRPFGNIYFLWWVHSALAKKMLLCCLWCSVELWGCESYSKCPLEVADLSGSVLNVKMKPKVTLSWSSVKSF